MQQYAQLSRIEESAQTGHWLCWTSRGRKYRFDVKNTHTAVSTVRSAIPVKYSAQQFSSPSIYIEYTYNIHVNILYIFNMCLEV